MRRRLDMNKIAKGLGAERRGAVKARSGHFGAMELVADVQARFQTPSSGGRPTDPRWTERRLIPLAPKTLDRLEKLAATVRKQGVNLEPLQLAALLLERTTEELNEAEAVRLARPPSKAAERGAS